MRTYLPITMVLAVFALTARAAQADEVPAQVPAQLVIGTKLSPPFAMKGSDGRWTGISIELWKQIAADLGVSYRIEEYDLPGLLAAVVAHQVDVGVGAITINAERERELDFSHPIYSTGLSIAVARHQERGVWASLRGLLTWSIVKVVAALLLMLAVIGALVWLSERRRNPAQFGGGPLHGIAAGLWWSAVTMTTVGYGDKAPVTVPGRMLALLWMFTAIIIFSLFTASVTTALTVDRLDTPIKGPTDLASARVGTVAGSTSAAYLDHHAISYRPIPDVLTGMKALARGELDAVVYDAPILEYTAKHSLGDAVFVLPNEFKHQNYGFVLAEGSSLREPINRALLVEINSESWQAIVEHFVGHD